MTKAAATGVLPALLLGLFVMGAHGAPPALPAMNLAAFAIGFVLVLAVGERFAALVYRRPAAVALAVLGAEALTLAAPGIDGVHRWVSLGTIRLHPAAIGDPLLLLAAAVLWCRARPWTAISLVAAGLAIHVLQPDAGQATALAAGALVLGLAPPLTDALPPADALPLTDALPPAGAPPPADVPLTGALPPADVALQAGSTVVERIALLAMAAAGAALAWSRPDPLPPVDMVENILFRAFELHPLAGALAIGALAWLSASALRPFGAGYFLAKTPRSSFFPSRGGVRSRAKYAGHERPPAAVLSAYWLASVAVIFFGDFPTPILGFGASPILGAVLGFSLWARAGQPQGFSPPPPEPPPPGEAPDGSASRSSAKRR